MNSIEKIANENTHEEIVVEVTDNVNYEAIENEISGEDESFDFYSATIPQLDGQKDRTDVSCHQQDGPPTNNDDYGPIEELQRY